MMTRHSRFRIPILLPKTQVCLKETVLFPSYTINTGHEIKTHDCELPIYKFEIQLKILA